MTDDLDPLLQKLPRRTAPASLRARLERKHVRRWRAQNVAIALVALSFVGVILFFGRRVDRNAPESPLVTEAVNDHLRVLYSDHPLEIESGGIHQVKPWFAGRVDFAPIVPFDGDADFPLQGGLVAYYIDRKAACFVYKRNLHVITLFVLPAHDLPWPRAGRMTSETRGFHTILWRADDLGYALVSDVAMSELTLLEHKLQHADPLR
jgi:anti-sigma factor RsiW